MKLRIYIFLFLLFGISSVYSQSAKKSILIIEKNQISNNKGISIYPNPVADFFRINSQVAIKEIEIYNLIGKRILSLKNDNSGLFDVSNLRNGIYLVRVFDRYGKVLKVLRLGINNESP